MAQSLVGLSLLYLFHIFTNTFCALTGGLFAGAQTAGLVTAGSAFATVQSAAMGGAAAASAVGTILQGLGVATVAGSCGLGSWMGKDDTEEEL